ncbi:MAG: alpha/beta hydrolase [Mycobacterium sp.]
MVDVDEFAYLPENAEQAGVSGPLPPVERIEHGPVSALRWGAGAVKVVFLHGGGQNAHTWDTVILGLGLSALAIDLPGHGRSQWREDGDYGPVLNAEAVEPVIRELAPDADLVVGMSLGGLTAMRLAVCAPELVRKLVMVDVTPSAPARVEQMSKAQMGAVALVQGERTFPSFEAMVDAAVAASPQRSRESLRRGVFHNSKQLGDGTWTWRYDSFRKAPSDERSEPGNQVGGFTGLWDDVPALRTPTTLVRGAKSFFVNDDDAAEFACNAPGFQRVFVVPDSGHSVQGDQPRALVEILRSVLAG